MLSRNGCSACVTQDLVVQAENGLLEMVGNLEAFPFFGRKLDLQVAGPLPGYDHDPSNQRREERDRCEKDHQSENCSRIHGTPNCSAPPSADTLHPARNRANYNYPGDRFFANPGKKLAGLSVTPAPWCDFYAKIRHFWCWHGTR
jgi:hypothetical protein